MSLRSIRLWLVLAVVLGLSLSEGHAQVKPLNYSVTLGGATASKQQLPFWLVANQGGRLSRTGTNLFSRFRVSQGLRPLTEDLSYGWGADLLGRSAAPSTLNIHQLYGRLQYNGFRLTVGRKKHLAGVVDTAASSGSLMWSGNAAPLPRISIGTARYLSVPGTAGFVSVKGYLAHGWFPESRHVKSPYLHEKYGYIRLLPASFPVQGYAGIVQNSTWAGVHPEVGQLPKNWSDYLQTVAGYRSDKTGNTADLGNTVAMYDFGLAYRFSGIKGLVYREFYIEDKPALFFRSPWDGLWGVSIQRQEQNHLVNRITWEHLYTRRQGSKYSEGEKPGADNYYNHSIYRSGWTYHGRAIGSPLLFSDGKIKGVVNNSVVAHHLGVTGRVTPAVRYKFFFTYSRNYGARRITPHPDRPQWISGRTPRQDQYSYLLELAGPLTQRYPLGLTAALAFDHGQVHDDNNIGLMVGLSWKGQLR